MNLKRTGLGKIMVPVRAGSHGIDLEAQGGWKKYGLSTMGYGSTLESERKSWGS
jgi:hypothetical protein